MARKRVGAEQIIPKLREAEVEIAQGATVAVAAKQIGVTEQTFYRWKKEYGGLKMDQAKRLKELEKGRMVMWSRSTESCGMSCWTGKSSRRTGRRRC